MAFDKALALKETKEAYLNNGYALQQMGKFDESIESLVRGLRIESDSFNATIFQSKLHYNLASSYIDIYQNQLESNPDKELLRKAKSHLDQALVGLRENTDYQGDLYGLRAMLHEFEGNYEKSIEMYDKTINIRIAQFFETESARSLAVTNNNAGSLLLKGFFESDKMKQKGYEHAIKYFEEALYIFNAGNFLYEKAFTLFNLGEAYYKLGSADVALEHLNSSLGIFKSYSSPHVQKVETLIAEIKNARLLGS
jgi:tetratricopeptide (TPR) repeat protein